MAEKVSDDELVALRKAYGATGGDVSLLLDHIELLTRELEERTNSQTHAESLLNDAMAFCSGWTFADLDPDCGSEAESLDERITALFAYGWPRAQHGVDLSRAHSDSTETARSE